MRSPGPLCPSLAFNGDRKTITIVDQRRLPWQLEMIELSSIDQAIRAIKEMWVRGAPLIGATAAYGLCFALRQDPSDTMLSLAAARLSAARPTAKNLDWAVQRVVQAAGSHAGEARVAAAFACAETIRTEDVANNLSLARHGLALIRSLALGRAPVNVLTHCNAGALAAVEVGTALGPVFAAHDAGVPVHVWVGETRPRNQGASLTAYELACQGVPHTVVTDNAGGHLMQQGRVDLCLVGADRVARNGDVCNKVGTYLKALAAHDNGVGFYAVFPLATYDATASSGAEIPIEERDAAEVRNIVGRLPDGSIATVSLTHSPVANPAFDITPARLISGYITERGLSTTWRADQMTLTHPASVTEAE